MKNLKAKGGINEVCSGVLLYPTVEESIRLRYLMDGQKLMVCTIDLNQDWKGIDRDLREILEAAMD